MTHIPVEGQRGLYRDSKTNAIINKNNLDYENYLKQKGSQEMRKMKIAKLECDVNEIKNDLSEIKKLITYLIEK